MAADPYKNYFLERTKGAIKNNFTIQLSRYKLYENGNCVQEGFFPRYYDEYDITLILKEDTLIIQSFGLESFDIRNQNYVTVDKSGVYAQKWVGSYVATFLVTNCNYSVNPGQIPYKIIITTNNKGYIYSLSLFFQNDGNERELELFGRTEWFIMDDRKPAREPSSGTTDENNGLPF